MRESDEQRLAERARRGDQSGFAALVERLAPSLVTFFAIRGLDPVASEEAVQETFVRAFRSLETYSPEHAFRSWVYGIAGNVYLQARRQRVRHAHSELAEGHATVRDLEPSEALEDEERRAAIRAALAGLPERMQIALQLRFFEGMRCDEIARVLGTTVEAVSPLIYRAKAILRERLEGVGSGRWKRPDAGGGS